MCRGGWRSWWRATPRYRLNPLLCGVERCCAMLSGAPARPFCGLRHGPPAVQGRGGLLAQIQASKNKKLNKTVTKDTSGPAVGGKGAAESEAARRFCTVPVPPHRRSPLLWRAARVACALLRWLKRAAFGALDAAAHLFSHKAARSRLSLCVVHGTARSGRRRRRRRWRRLWGRRRRRRRRRRPRWAVCRRDA